MGVRPKTVDDGEGWEQPPGGYWDDGSGTQTGGGTATPPDQQTEDAKDTPCVNEVPAGVDLNHLNDLAKSLGTTLASLQDTTGNEWGAFVYRGTDGQLHQSTPFTGGHPDDLFGATASLPTGAYIVGYVHTHPIDLLSDQRMLSNVDRAYIQTLVGLTGGVRADPNLLAYITTKDKDGSTYSDKYSTFVYDHSKRSATSPGCDL